MLSLKTEPAKKYFFILFLASCVLLELFTFAIYKQWHANRTSNEWVEHSYGLLNLSQSALADAADMASYEQQYRVTDSAKYLASYQKSVVSLENHLTQLNKSVMDNPEQQASVAALWGKIEPFEKICEFYLHKLPQKSTVYSLNAGTIAIHRSLLNAREAFDTFDRNENTLLQERLAKAGSERSNYLWTLGIGSVLSMIALIAANLIIFWLFARSERAEARLVKNEKFFSTIITGINDGIYDYDALNDTITYSDSYPKILGYTGEELGRDHEEFYRLVHPDDVASVRETMRSYFDHEIPVYRNVFRARHRDGRWVWMLSRGIGIWDENGRIQRLIGTHTDITAQKEREEELNFFIRENERQKQELEIARDKAETANQAKSDFLAVMSHEIRTPLNVIIGLAHLLKEKVQSDEKRTMVDTLYANANILLKFVSELLDLSRVESAQVEFETHAFAIPPMLQGLHAMFADPAKNKGLSFSVTDHTRGQFFIGDPSRIQQIVVNLINNALKFTENGSIAVEASMAQRGNAKVDLTIKVADTGIGISPDKLSMVFDKFVQADQSISRRFGGSGLGLAISKSLAQLMGGDIAVISKPNEGSTFILTLPLELGRGEDVRTLPKQPALKPTTSRGSVLLVEDYEANIMVATMMLEHLGYAVDAARSGSEALEKIKAQRTPYMAILMDVRMRDMDGFETTRRVREHEKTRGFSQYIIGVTAHALASDRDRCLEAGMDEYMSKPINPDLLAQKLNSLAKAA
jgi:PAS domain S-box-containing protein